MEWLIFISIITLYGSSLFFGLVPLPQPRRIVARNRRVFEDGDRITSTEWQKVDWKDEGF